jgi:tape measure domain-containing protein
MVAVTADKVIVELEARTKQHNDAVAEAANVFDTRMSQVEKRANVATNNVAESLKGIGLALASALVVDKVVEYADAWTKSANRLRAVGVEAGAVAAKQQQLLDLANNARVGFEDVVDLYSRLTTATSQLGTSEADVVKLTDTISKAMKSAGASTSETQSAVLQLGQALGSGVLQGDELRSLRENAPVLAQAIAAEFGVTIGQLKKLGETGQLTSDRVIKAILGMSDAVNTRFATSVATIGDSFTILENQTIAFIGKLNDVTGAGELFGNVMIAIANNLSLVTAALVVLGGRALQGVIASTVASTRAAVANKIALAQQAIAYVSNGLAANGTALSVLEAARAEQAAAAASIRLAASELRTAQAAQVVSAAHLKYDVTLEAMQASIARVAAAEAGLTAAHERLAVANVAATTAMGGLTLSARVATVALTTLRTVGQGLFALLGGPWGIALIALAAGFYYLSSQESASEQATKAHAAAMSSWNDEANIAKGNLDSINSKLTEMTANQKAAAQAAASTALADQLKDLEKTVAEARQNLLKNVGVTSGDSFIRALVGGSAASTKTEVAKFFSQFEGVSKEEIAKINDALQGTLFAFTEGDTEMAGRALGDFQQIIADLRRTASDEAKPALDALAIAIGGSGEKAEEANKNIDRARATLTLLIDPTNAWARTVLQLGDQLNAAAAEADGFNAALNRLKGNNAQGLDSINRQIIALRTGGLKAYKEEVADQKQTTDASTQAQKSYANAIGKTSVTQDQLNEALFKNDPLAIAAVKGAEDRAAAERALAEQLETTTEAERKANKKGRGGPKETKDEKRDNKEDSAIIGLQDQIKYQNELNAAYGSTALQLAAITAEYEAMNNARTKGYKVGSDAYKQAVEEYKQNALALAQAKIKGQQLAEGDALTKSVMTSQEKYNAKIVEYTAALANGSITTDTYHKLVKAANDANTGYAEGFNALAGAIQSGIQGATSLADAIGKIALSLANLVAQAALSGTGPLSGLFNALTGTVGGLAGGFAPAASSMSTIGGIGANVAAVGLGSLPGRARGGDVSPNQAYWVGEKGPEPFIPNVPGTIIPANKAGSSGGSVRNYNAFVDNPTGDQAIKQAVTQGMLAAIKTAGDQAPMKVNEYNRRKATTK